MNVNIFNRQRTRKVNLHLLRQIADALLQELEIRSGQLEINLMAAGEMTRLNETFLQHAGSTDVIAFDYQSSEFPVRNSEFQISGELFICVDEAVLQARRFRTNWQSEITRYLIHGILHLLGRDDSRAIARRKMKHEEDRLLQQLSRRFSLAQLARAARISKCKSH